MNISFVRNGSVVEVKLSISVPGHDAVTYSAAWDAQEKFYAGFLVSAMQQQMMSEMERMRREAYEKGWKDAKSKKHPKESWFSSKFGGGTP